jgi:hypothetical protein
MEIVMGGLSIYHILILLIVVAVYLAPIAKILGRAGWNRWLVILWIIPLVNIVMLWVFAYGEWPAMKERSDAFS